MEEYLQYMKTLRSQMNDVEDQATKISFEEQMQITTIQTMENDIKSAISEAEQLREESEQMLKVKGQVCSQILGKQRKITSLEVDSSTLSQTLELLQQERVSLSVKLAQKSTHYAKVEEDINIKLQQQQEWLSSHIYAREKAENKEVNTQLARIEGKCGMESNLRRDETGKNARKNLVAQLESAKAKIDELAQMKSKLCMENSKLMQSIDRAKFRMKDFTAGLLSMELNVLDDEHKALLADKAGEAEYSQSLLDQINKLKGISHVIKCACGDEYKVEVDFGA